jgi:hypothetical protein
MLLFDVIPTKHVLLAVARVHAPLMLYKCAASAAAAEVFHTCELAEHDRLDGSRWGSVSSSSRSRSLRIPMFTVNTAAAAANN